MVEGSPALGKVYFVTNGEARPFWDFLTAIFDGMGYPPPTKAIGQRLAYGTAFVLEKAGGMLKYFMNFRPKLTRQLAFNMSMNHYFSLTLTLTLTLTLITRQLVFNMSMNHYFSHAKATLTLRLNLTLKTLKTLNPQHLNLTLIGGDEGDWIHAPSELRLWDRENDGVDQEGSLQHRRLSFRPLGQGSEKKTAPGRSNSNPNPNPNSKVREAISPEKPKIQVPLGSRHSSSSFSTSS